MEQLWNDGRQGKTEGSHSKLAPESFPPQKSIPRLNPRPHHQKSLTCRTEKWVISGPAKQGLVVVKRNTKLQKLQTVLW